MNLIERTVELASENVEREGCPFSCVVARTGDGRVVAESPNLVQQTNDPTAHAEVLAVRQACQRLGTPSLEGHPDAWGCAYQRSKTTRVVRIVKDDGEGFDQEAIELLILGRVVAYSRRNALARAPKEIGKVQRSLFCLK